MPWLSEEVLGRADMTMCIRCHKLSHTCSMTWSRAPLKAAMLSCRLDICCCIAAISFRSFRTRFISFSFDISGRPRASAAASVTDVVGGFVARGPEDIPALLAYGEAEDFLSTSLSTAVFCSTSRAKSRDVADGVVWNVNVQYDINWYSIVREYMLQFNVTS